MNRILNVCHSGFPLINTRLFCQRVPLVFKAPSRFLSNRVVLDPNTNVAKDVILYKYENPRFFKLINIFAIVQFGFWNYLSHFSYTTLRDAPVPQEDTENLRFWERINLGENKYRNSIAAMCLFMGWGILAVAWTFTLRSVRYLVLNKGGNAISFVTYAPFGENRIMKVPINCISAVESREFAKATLPIKVKNRALFYVLDMKGEFRNPALFDQTAGLRRKWAK
ncbi:transmembrane protein 223 [Culicoides brevitarsis]|uniref:transmembrane protein 223 n=1 Tax=Culicoides brevitarsis TaxID=469753 RepID=UPI00307B46E6